MADVLLLHHAPEEERAALIRDGRLCELDIERKSGRTLSGNIYRGRVARISAELDAAFVDLGTERMGMLHAGDVLWVGGLEAPPPQTGPDSGAPPTLRSKRPIGALVEVNQEILVQVVREPSAKKGPRVTMHVSLPGRNIVLLPTQPHIGVSRMIDDPAERDRLWRVLRLLLPPEMGAIVRTVGDGATEAELGNDAGFLRAQWSDVLARHQAASAPSLLHVDLDLTLRAVRDHVGPTTETIWIDDPNERERVERFVQRFHPGAAPVVRVHDAEHGLFEAHGVPQAIRAALEPRVPLTSGGELVIERTEAMTVIDVNSARHSGGEDLHDAILRLNLEAAREVAWQLRLRNLGGLCVVDFVDMKRPEDRRMLEAVLEAELASDPARVRMTRMNRFGLVELTRKRVRESIYERLTEPCPCCQGRGFVRSATDLAVEALDRLRRTLREEGPGAQVRIELPPRGAAVLGDQLSAIVDDLARVHQAKVEITASRPDAELRVHVRRGR
ncbi:MAG: RNAse [Pseudomonadota bacterium]